MSVEHNTCATFAVVISSYLYSILQHICNWLCSVV